MAIPFSEVKPASIKMKVLPTIPSKVVANGFLTAVRASNEITIDVDYTKLVDSPIVDQTTSFVAIYDAHNNLYKLASVAAIANEAGGDVIGPPSAGNGNVITFSGTSGKLVQDSGVALSSFLQVQEPLIVTADGTITAGTGAVAIQKSAPTATNLTVPSVDNQGGIPLSVFDWSTSITEHAIKLTAAAGETIMKQPFIMIYSTPDQLAGITLYPSTTLNGWFIAP